MMKVKPVTLGKTQRMSFSRIDEVIDMPNLIEVQKNSYKWFLDQGLKEVFHDVATIEDPVEQNARYLDKLVDELARGRAMEKILRS